MSKEIIHTEEYKGYKINIHYSEADDSPDDWGDDNLFLVYDHRDFYIKREGFSPQDIYNYLFNKKTLEENNINELRDIPETNSITELECIYSDVIESEYEDYYIFEVEAYIHSGISLSLFTGVKQCRWDSSVSGYILASKDEFKTPEEAELRAEGLIETWNQYLDGSIYGFEVIKEDFCSHCNTTIEEFIDSCGGYYGDYEKSGCLNEARAVIDNLTKETTND